MDKTNGNNSSGEQTHTFSPKNGDTRIILKHEVESKGVFDFELKDKTEISISGQCHTLYEIEEVYEDGEWCQDLDNREEVDFFYLTGYEKGFSYDVSDIYKFFEVGLTLDWDWNGMGFGQSGIKDEDDYETSLKKWKDYKSKFPRVTSKEQFEIIKY